MDLNLVKIFLPSTLAFFFGMLFAPMFARYIVRKKLWKKTSRATDEMESEFIRIHNTEAELATPRVGGAVIWLSVIATVFILFILSKIFPGSVTEKMQFLSRSQTLIPIGVFLLSALIGLFDDILQIKGKGNYAHDASKYRNIKVLIVIGISLLVSFWLFFKLDISSIAVPFLQSIDLGILFIPFFIFVSLAIFSTSVIDGVDGLAGGIFASIFAGYTVIAFFNNQIDIAAFSSVVTGGIFAFLWFNIPPAKFYMGETGMLALTMTLTVIAFLTDTVILLPIIALPLLLTSLSVIIQYISKKYRNGKKVFRLTPLPLHFLSLGWSRERVTMRFWILSIISVILGVILSSLF